MLHHNNHGSQLNSERIAYNNLAITTTSRAGGFMGGGVSLESPRGYQLQDSNSTFGQKRKPYLLPSIVKATQSPAMKPFVSQGRLAIKEQKYKRVTPKPEHKYDSSLGTAATEMFNRRDLINPPNLVQSAFTAQRHLSNDVPLLQKPRLLGLHQPSKSALKPGYPSQSKNNANTSPFQTQNQFKNEQGLLQFMVGGQSEMAETVRSGGTLGGGAQLNAVYNHTHYNNSINQQQRASHTSNVIVRNFDIETGMQSQLTGTKCLIPVSENEDLQIKAAMVNLRRLKLDIEMKQLGASGLTSSAPENSKRESTTQLSNKQREHHKSSLIDVNGGGNQLFNKQMVINASVTEKVKQLPELANVTQTTIGSVQQISKLLPQEQFIIEQKLATKPKELRIPDADPAFQYPSNPNPKEKALPVRDQPMLLSQSSKVHEQLMNFSKYKQLKKYNDSLMKIQQEMVQTYKERRKAAKMRDAESKMEEQKSLPNQVGNQQLPLLQELQSTMPQRRESNRKIRTQLEEDVHCESSIVSTDIVAGKAEIESQIAENDPMTEEGPDLAESNHSPINEDEQFNSSSMPDEVQLQSIQQAQAEETNEQQPTLEQISQAQQLNQLHNTSSPKNNPYLKSIPQQRTVDREDPPIIVKEQELMKTKQQFYKNDEKQLSIFKTDFQFGHHKFIPKKTFYATKKEYISSYKRAILENHAMTDLALTINQANLRHRYNLVVLERTHETTDESQQAMASIKPTPQENQNQKISLHEREEVLTPEEGMSVDDQHHEQALNNEEKQADVKVIINQKEMMEQEHHRYLANREKIDTLQNLRHQNSYKKSSTLSGGNNSNRSSTMLIPASVTPNLNLPIRSSFAGKSQPGSPNKDGAQTAGSSLGGRVVIVHKQHSSLSGAEEIKINSNGGSPKKQDENQPEESHGQRLVKHAPHRRSKSNLEVLQPENSPSKFNEFKKKVFKKCREVPYSHMDSHRPHHLKFIPHFEYHDAYNGPSQKVPRPSCMPPTELMRKNSEERGLFASERTPTPKNRGDQTLKRQTLQEYMEEQRPKQVLVIKQDILKELEVLRKNNLKEAQTTKAIMKNNAVLNHPLMKAATGDELDHAKFFQTEIAIAGTVNPSPIDGLDTPQIKGLIPDNATANRSRRGGTTDDQLSLNFPMRNSRLSQAVMASLTKEAMRNTNKSANQSKSQKLTNGSIEGNDDHIKEITSLTASGQGAIVNMAATPLQPDIVKIISPKVVTAVPPLDLKKQNPPFSIRDEEEPTLNDRSLGSAPIFEGILVNEPHSARNFVKTYFKNQEVECFKEMEQKQRMVVVRQAVAKLEREHFNVQTINQIKVIAGKTDRSSKNNKQSPIQTARDSLKVSGQEKEASLEIKANTAR